MTSPPPTLHWMEAGEARSAHWRSERGAPPPKRVVLADDTTTADAAYRLACEGTALLWRGDFQNARQLLQALARRIDKPVKASKQARVERKKAAGSDASGVPAGQAFHLYRQAQSQRARVLGMVLIEFGADYSIGLRRAPDAKQACAEVWGAAGEEVACVASLRELMGVISAHEWRKKGVEIPALGKAPNNRIHPHYGVFSPVRGEYVDLVANAPLPAARPSKFVAFDIGTGTGVLSAVLALRDIDQVVATDQDPRALACARENLYRLRLPNPVKVMQADLFPEGLASVIVCNPPWLPARPGSPLEGAVYDEGSRMLLGFLSGLAAHLAPGGEGWLILSDFAEHLGLRTRAELLAAIEGAGLKVLGRIDAKPEHPKAEDATDPLHAARAAEVTSLWRLAAA
ncbi:MAG: class I SAM-dependent methyltransferase [Polaromonas sp.]|nr:class I SAM-dependent methyltransferase [Polaromonas sp.]